MKKILFTTFLIFIINIKIFAVVHYAVISGLLTQIENGDSVKLAVSTYACPSSDPLFAFKFYTGKIVNHRFRFKIQIGNVPLYTEIRFGSKQQVAPLIGYFIEKGDNIFIKSANGDLLFSGPGAEKFNIIYRLNKIEKQDFEGIGEDRGHPSGLLNIAKKTDLTGSQQLLFLNKHRKFLTDNTYVLIKSHILSLIYGTVSSLYYWDDSSLKDSAKNIALTSIKNYHRKLPLELMDDKDFNNNRMLKYAGNYASSIVLKYQLDSCYLLNRPFLVDDCYQFVKQNYSGALRESIITNLLYFNRKDSQDISSSLKNALTIIKDKEFTGILKKIQSLQIKGATAYNFNLPDTLGVLHRLNDYKGKVIMIDVWYTGCGNCARVAPYLQKIEQSFENQPVVFLSVNIDRNKSVWLQSVESGRYTSHDVINLYTQGLGTKHPFCLYYDIIQYPTLILIDKTGKLIKNPVDPRIDNGLDIASLIKSEISK